MKTYKITTPHNGCIQYTQSGKDLYCSILDKFNIEYKIEEITPTKENDIPHSEVRRMESEGVNEEKFGEPNSSRDDSYEHSEYYWDTERNKDIQDWEETSFGKAHKKFTNDIKDFETSSQTHQPVYFNEEWNSSHTLGNDEVEVRFLYEPKKPL
tara:strand:+ start:1781 stop:2242 length:462 start_codon:yes stop_codon:yes gene_type:complete